MNSEGAELRLFTFPNALSSGFIRRQPIYWKMLRHLRNVYKRRVRSLNRSLWPENSRSIVR